MRVVASQKLISKQYFGSTKKSVVKKEQTRFPLLGDFPEKNFSAVVNQERLDAGLNEIPEIDAHRSPFYWNISTKKSSKKIPLSLAEKINNELGDSVRAFGSANRVKGKKFLSFIKSLNKTFEGIFIWHADTKEGLEGLVKILKEHFGKK